MRGCGPAPGTSEPRNPKPATRIAGRGGVSDYRSNITLTPVGLGGKVLSMRVLTPSDGFEYEGDFECEGADSSNPASIFGEHPSEPNLSGGEHGPIIALVMARVRQNGESS